MLCSIYYGRCHFREPIVQFAPNDFRRLLCDQLQFFVSHAFVLLPAHVLNAHADGEA